MSARLPLLQKTPFVLDERALHEATSPHAGLLGLSRVFRSLGLPGLIEANLALRKRDSGFSEGQLIESLVLLQALGGECPEDMHLLAGDDCLERGLGYAPPKATAVPMATDTRLEIPTSLQCCHSSWPNGSCWYTGRSSAGNRLAKSGL